MKANNSLPSFNENFDFHTVLPPLGKATTNTGMRFTINEEGRTVEYTHLLVPPGLNLTQAATPGQARAASKRKHFCSSHRLQPL